MCIRGRIAVAAAAAAVLSAPALDLLPLSFSILGAKHWTQTFFSQTFRALPGYPSKIPAYPAKKVWFPWFRGAYRTFWPPPLHVEDPYPTGKYPGSKVWVWVLLSLARYLSLSRILWMSFPAFQLVGLTTQTRTQDAACFWTQRTWMQTLALREASKSQDIIVMRFMNASVLRRKSLNRKLDLVGLSITDSPPN